MYHQKLLNMLSFLGRYRKFFTILTAVFVSVLFFLFVPPEVIVEKIGVEGGYIVIFLLALLGVSSFVSASFYTTLVVFATSGEFNPFLLALFSAPGRIVGDSMFFFLGLHGRKVKSEFWQKFVNSFSSWLKKFPRWVPLFITYGYTGFTPLPHDFLMVALGVGGVSYKFLLPVLLIGNATFVLFVSFLSIK